MTATRQVTIGVETGFTLIEILVTLAIVALLAALTMVNLGKPQITASVNDTVDTLVADLKSQQLLAMSGDSGSASSQQPHGLYVQAGQYTLFAGSSYDSGDTNNYSADASQGISLTTTFPGAAVVFDKGSGEVHDFSDGSNTITIHGTDNTKAVTVNRLGSVSVN